MQCAGACVCACAECVCLCPRRGDGGVDEGTRQEEDETGGGGRLRTTPTCPVPPVPLALPVLSSPLPSSPVPSPAAATCSGGATATAPRSPTKSSWWTTGLGTPPWPPPRSLCGATALTLCACCACPATAARALRVRGCCGGVAVGEEWGDGRGGHVPFPPPPLCPRTRNRWPPLLPNCTLLPLTLSPLAPPPPPHTHTTHSTTCHTPPPPACSQVGHAVRPGRAPADDGRRRRDPGR